MSLDECRHPAGEDGKKGKGPSRTETTRGKQMRMRVPETWVRPPDGWVKLNVDASFVAATGCAGTGVVARDSTGKIKLTAWRALFNCSSAVEAEAHACVEGIRLASQWCHGPIILESDCARVVQALSSKSVDRSEISFIVAEGKELSQLLMELKIVKVSRDCNKVANELAALARRNTHSAVWLGQAPACVTDLINSDCIQEQA